MSKQAEELCEFCKNPGSSKWGEKITTRTYKDGWLIRIEYICKKCGRIVYDDIL